MERTTTVVVELSVGCIFAPIESVAELLLVGDFKIFCPEFFLESAASSKRAGER